MDKNPSLADLGDWDEVKLGSHSFIRHSYENALDASARLFSFATGTAPVTDGPIAERQEALAAADLLALAIHSRRLIDNTISLRRASKVLVRTVRPKGKGHSPITRITNVIIHHSDLQIFRYENYLKYHLRQISFDGLFQGPGNRITPLCVVSSDKEKLLSFEIRELIETFQKGILNLVIDVCGEHHVWLDDEMLR